MRLTGSALWKTAITTLLLWCCQGALAANFEQSDPEAAGAIRAGNVEEVRRIFADPKRVGSVESNIFVLQDVYLLAVTSGSVPLLKYLDSRGWLARLKGAPSINMGTAALVAAQSGSNGVLDYLASQRVDLSVPDPDVGNTAMHGAASSGKVGTVRHLCELGLRPDVRNRGGQTDLELAEYNLRVSSKGGPEDTAEYKESLRQIVEYLKEKGPDGCTAKARSEAPK